ESAPTLALPSVRFAHVGGGDAPSALHRLRWSQSQKGATVPKMQYNTETTSIRMATAQTPSMLSWDDFRYVKAIADTRSLGGAAAELSVNHSTVFRRLAQIEKGLGSRLFERSRGGYALTPCGEEMVRLAERMGEDIVAFERQVTGHDLRPSGELRVTTNDTALIYLMTQVFAGFRHADPEIVLDVVVSNQALNLSKRDADVAVRATDRPPDALIGRRVANISWAVFAASKIAPKSFDPVKDGHNVDWIGFGDNLANLKAAKWLKE